MRRLEIKKKIKFILFFITLIFLLIEIILRFLNIEYPIFQKHDPIRGFSLLENSSGNWNREGKGYVSINSDGLRDVERDIKKPINTIRIAILGDSFAEARSLNLNDTFWSKLNLNQCKNFHKGKKIEVINFGVAEYGTTQQYLTLKNNVWKYDPDLIILAFYSGNDISDNLKSLSKKKYRPYFLFREDGGFEIDNSYLNSKPYKFLSSLPGRFFIKFSQYSRIAQLLRESYVQMYFKNISKKKPTKEIKEINNFDKSNLYNPLNSDWSRAWFITEKIIKMIDIEIKNKKKEFILVTLSTPIQVHPDNDKVENFKKENNINDIFYPENRLDNFSQKNSIKFIQLAKKMREIALEKSIFFHGFNNTKMGTGHWNKSGHELASRLISEQICNFY